MALNDERNQMPASEPQKPVYLSFTITELASRRFLASIVGFATCALRNPFVLSHLSFSTS
jgi:hypothetical protein